MYFVHFVFVVIFTFNMVNTVGSDMAYVSTVVIFIVTFNIVATVFVVNIIVVWFVAVVVVAVVVVVVVAVVAVVVVAVVVVAVVIVVVFQASFNGCSEAVVDVPGTKLLQICSGNGCDDQALKIFQKKHILFEN